MTSVCATPFKLPGARWTLLDACGVPSTSATSSITTTGIIEVAETTNFEDREEFFEKNGDGTFCVQETNAPIMKYKELVFKVCTYDPELINMLTAEPLILDDATTPKSVGFRSRVGSAALSNFAMEGWTRTTNAANCSTTSPLYGYVLYPYCKEGVVDDVTWGNSNIVLTIKCRTAANPGWGVGPYNVVTSQAATLTTGQPMPLLTPVTSADHRIFRWTNLAPPPATCGAGPSTCVLPTITKVGSVATLTFPTPAQLPAIINWGDGTADTTVTTGTTTTHTYTSGTYNVTYNPTNYSQPPCTGSVTIP